MSNPQKDLFISNDLSVRRDDIESSCQDMKELLEIGRAFTYNISSTNRLIKLPSFFAHYTALHGQTMQQDMYEGMNLLVNSDITDDAERRRVAWDKAQKSVVERAKTPEGTQRLEQEQLGIFNLLLNISEFEDAIYDIFAQGTVLLWGAFEVLSRDIITLMLNKYPQKANDLINDEIVKKRFNFKSFSYETLSTYGFDISNKIGTLFSDSCDLSDLSGLKAILRALYQKDGEVLTSLGDKELWILNQRRNLIVHRRGIVDRKYLDNTGDSFELI